MQTLRAVLDGEVPPMADLCADVPAALAAGVLLVRSVRRGTQWVLMSKSLTKSLTLTLTLTLTSTQPIILVNMATIRSSRSRGSTNSGNGTKASVSNASIIAAHSIAEPLAMA